MSTLMEINVKKICKLLIYLEYFLFKIGNKALVALCFLGRNDDIFGAYKHYIFACFMVHTFNP